MPIELQIIRAREFVRLGAHGHFDLKISKAVLAELARACCKRGIKQALLDLRDLHPGPKPVFSPNDLVTLVNTFREVGFTHQDRLAVLYGSDPHHRARLFSFIATLRGWKVHAFDNYELAIAWLSDGDEPKPEAELHPAKSQKIPVRRQQIPPPAAKPVPQPKITILKSSASTPRKAGTVKPRRGISSSARASVMLQSSPR
jgi:hypothetical protein